MNLSEFAFKLLLLFLPGIICSVIVDTFTNHNQRAKFEYVVNSFVYGLMAYTSYYVINELINMFYDKNLAPLVFLDSLFVKGKQVAFKEIFYACVVAFFLGCLITFMHTHKLQFRLFRKLGITNKFGELDVWGYFMNSPDVNWLTVRDIDNNLMYDGWVQAFSDNSKEAEILLGDVKVYKNDEGEFLYEVSSQYLSLDRTKILIEVRKGESENE
jgi:hypothetical protein